MLSRNVVGEYNTVVCGVPLRLDHSLITEYSINGITYKELEVFEPLGYDASSFKSEIQSLPPCGVCVMSFSADYWVPVYRHKTLGISIPFYAMEGTWDLSKISDEDIERFTLGTAQRLAVDHLRQNFELIGLSSKTAFEGRLEKILDMIPSGSLCFLLLQKEYYGVERKIAAAVVDLNKWICNIAAGRPNVRIIAIGDFIEDPSEIETETDHAKRIVYHRIFEHIRERCSGLLS